MLRVHVLILPITCLLWYHKINKYSNVRFRSFLILFLSVSHHLLAPFPVSIKLFLFFLIGVLLLIYDWGFGGDGSAIIIVCVCFFWGQKKKQQWRRHRTVNSVSLPVTLRKAEMVCRRFKRLRRRKMRSAMTTAFRL